jgi:hypothetical protein
MEGKKGVRLRFPRPIRAIAVIGVTVAWAALGSVPALADQVRNQQYWLKTLHVTQAQKTTLGSGVTIALLDTGVIPAQPDLTGSVLPGRDFTRSGEKPGGAFYGNHGTAMASLIVGHGHGKGRAAGILGVAPGARLLSVRVGVDGGDPLLSESAFTAGLPAAIAAGIRYAVNNGAQVIDLPLDPGQSQNNLVATPFVAPAPNATPSPPFVAAQSAAGGSAAERSAVKYALSKGVVLVAPAGDNGGASDAANFPAAYPGVIAVGSFNATFTKSAFSSHLPYVTVTAAGESMVAAAPTGYATVSSTSAASAVVTGIATLIKSRYPEFTPKQVTQALTSSTVFRGAGAQNGSGHGTVDAAKALAAAATIAKPGPSRAGDNAVPAQQLPTLPPAQPQASDRLTPKLQRAAVLSLAVLVVLLIPILIYVIVRRRRRRGLAGPEPAVPAAYARNGGGQADQMLEYFAAMPAEPGGSRAAGGAWPGPRVSGPPSSLGPGYARAGNFSDSGPPTGDDLLHRRGETPARAPLTPITRASAVRPPRVSGTPPWGPAPKPEGELPWAASPTPMGLGRRPPLHNVPAPASSIWDTGGLGMPGPALEPEAEAEADAVGKPIYVWNPSASTETMPAQRHDSDIPGDEG